MRYNFLIGVINFSRDCERLMKILDIYTENAVLFSNNEECDFKIPEDEYISKTKNRIIDYAKEKEYEYVFILEDDILIKDLTIFDKYIELMEKYDLDVVSPGYNNLSNKVFGKIDNYSLIVNNYPSEGNKQYFGKIYNNEFIGLKVKDALYFQEDLFIFENQEYFQRAFNEKKIPCFGLFFDIEKSGDYIEFLNLPSIRQSNQKLKELVEKSTEIFKTKYGGPMQLTSDITQITKFLLDRREK